MTSNNPTFELVFLDDFDDLENVSEMVAETSEARRKISKAKVLPLKTTALQIYPSGIWRKYWKINNQTRPRKH